MEAFLYYLLRATVLSGLLYSIYKWVCSKNTFYALNRITLLFILVCIITIPLFTYDLWTQNQTKLEETPLWITTTENSVLQMQGEKSFSLEIPWVKLLSILYITGFALFFIYYCLGVTRLLQLIHKTEKKYLLPNGSMLCITNKKTAPFSWFKYIVLTEQDYTDENKAIIKHEQAHVWLRHSIDRLFYDLVQCLFWFNPFVWLLRRELQSVHEYQADEKVVQQGIDAKKYQLLLIRKSVGETKFAMANSFFQCDLQKRISMMMKNKTNSTKKWSYTLLLPLLLLSAFILSVPQLNATESLISKDSIKNAFVLEAQQVSNNNIAKEKVSISGTVKGTNGILTGVRVRVKSTGDETITNEKGYFKIEVNEGEVIVFSYEGYLNQELKVTKSVSNLVIKLKQKANPEVEKSPQEKSMYIVDEKEMSSGFDASSISPDEIERIEVLKGESATRLYGKKGEAGVIIITTKKYNKETKESQGEITIKSNEKSINAKDIKRLIIVDGVEQDKDFDFNSVSPQEIESITVLKDKLSIEQYGEKAKDGVIIINKKKKVKENE